jgi:hypothetical protein
MIEFMFCGMPMNYCTRITQKKVKKKVRNERDHLTLMRMYISVFIDCIEPEYEYYIHPLLPKIKG